VGPRSRAFVHHRDLSSETLEDEVIAGVLAHHARTAEDRNRAVPPPPAPGYDPADAERAVRQVAMTSVVKHVTRKALPTVTAVAAEQRSRNLQLRNEFPPRTVDNWWPHTATSLQQVQHRLANGAFVAAASGTRAGPRRGVDKLLRWLLSLPGDTWQDRWLASAVETRPGSSWAELPLHWLDERGEAASYDATDLASGLLMEFSRLQQLADAQPPPNSACHRSPPSPGGPLPHEFRVQGLATRYSQRHCS
jgi:hypothetical protein